MPAPPRVSASYQALPGHPADGYPAVSKVLLARLTDGFPPAAAVRVCTTDSTPYLAAGGWASWFLKFLKEKYYFFFNWRNCSRQIARHLAVQHVNKNYLNKTYIFLNE
jgi:hypothetical protein